MKANDEMAVCHACLNRPSGYDCGHDTCPGQSDPPAHVPHDEIGALATPRQTRTRMKAESLVPSFSTCETLRAKGFPQDTLCAWVAEEYEQGGVMVPCIPWLRADVGLWREGLVAAPTLQEVLAVLPQHVPARIVTDDGVDVMAACCLTVQPSPMESQRVGWALYYDGSCTDGRVAYPSAADFEGLFVPNANPAEAAALLYLALVEAGHIKNQKGGFGSAKGLIEMAPDFDAPLSDSEDGE